jgi:hypothetical protein
LDGLTVEWLLENGFGFQDFGTYVSGTLDNSGGSIRFKHAGTYELIARITDETGRVFLFENGGRIEVLPVLSISFELPEVTHTDRTIDLRTRGNNNVLPVEWSLTKDGEPVEVSDAMEGIIERLSAGKSSLKKSGNIHPHCLHDGCAGQGVLLQRIHCGLSDSVDFARRAAGLVCR